MSRIFRGTAFLLLLIFGLAVLAATPFGRNRIAKYAIDQIPLTDGHQFAFTKTAGSVLTNLTLHGIELTGPRGQAFVHIDTATVAIDILPLLSRKVSIRSLDLRGPTITARQLADGEWDLIKAFPVDTASSGLAVRMRTARIRNGSVTATHLSSGSDSVFSASDILVVAANVAMVDQYAIELQEFQARFNPPGLEEPAFARGAGVFLDGSVQLDTLSIFSPRTNLAVSGRVTIGETSERWQDRVENIALDLRADPVAFSDLSPFLSRLDPDATGVISATVTGSSSDVSFSVQADFDRDGAIDAVGHAGFAEGEPVFLDVDATADGLRGSIVDRVLLDQEDVFSGTIVADLSGATSRTIAGDVRFDFRNTNLPSFAISEPRLRIRFDAGKGSYSGSTRLAGQLVAAEGFVRPFEELPSYSGTVQIDSFDVSRVDTSLSEWATDLSGTINVRGSGFVEPNMSLSAAFVSSSINRFVVGNSSVKASYARNQATADLLVTGPTGSLSGSLSVRSIADARWQIDRLVAESLDIGSVLGGATDIKTTGSFNVSGSEWAWNTLRFDGVAQIDSARIADVHLNDVRLTAQKIGRAIRFVEAGRIDQTRVESEGVLTLSDIPILNISRGSFVGLDIGTYVDGQSSDLNGTFVGEIVGTDLPTINGRLTAQLGTSRVNSENIRGGSIAARITNGEIDFSTDLVAESGTIQLSGLANPFAAEPSFALRESLVSGINVGALIGRPDLSTRLFGTVVGRIRGTTLANLRGEALIQLDSTEVNRVHEIEGAVRLVATDTLTTAYADLNWAGDGAINGFVRRKPDLNGSSDFEHETELVVANLDVGQWLGTDSVSSDISAELTGAFRGTTLETMVATGNLIKLEGRLQNVDISSGSGVFELRDGVLHVDGGSLNSSAGTLLANGTVALLNTESAGESNLSFDATFFSLEPLAELVPRLGSLDGSGRIQGQVSGPPQSLYASSELHLESVDYKDRRIASIDAIVDASFDGERRLTMFDASADILNVILPTLSIRETTLHAALADSVFEIEGVSILDDRRSMRISGIVDPREDSRFAVVEDLSIKLDQDRWALLQPSTITYDDGVRVKNLLLFTDDQQIALDGIVNVRGEQSLILTVENFRIGAIADLFDYSGLDGTTNGYLDLTGPAEAPIVEGDLSVEVISNGVPVGDMQLAIRYDSLLLHNDALFRHVDGSTLTIEGQLPIDLRLAQSQGPTQTGVRVAARQVTADTQVDLQIVADSFAMGWMLPFLDKQFYNDLGGRINGNVQVLGTVRNPMLSGTAVVVDGSVGLPQFGIRPHHINADLEFKGNQIQIMHAQARSGRGSLIALGEVTLSDLTLGEFDVSLSMEDFLAMDNVSFRGATTSGDLLLYGDTRTPNLSGYLRMEQLDIFYAGQIEEFEPVKLSEQDLRQVEQTFGRRVTAADTTTFSFYEALQMDINLEMKRDTWLRSKQNPRMNIEFTGDMDLQKNPNEDERMFGTINVLPDRSTIDQFGRRFDITSGTVTYNGDFDNPSVEIVADYTVKSPTDRNDEVVINLKATGTLENLEVALNSDPQMELTDILSYVLTGRPAGETLQFSSGDTGIATDIALSQATGYLEGLAGSELGLDVVRIENDGSEIKLTAGKYIRNGVYLAISQPVVLNSSASGTSSQETNRPEFTVEVEIIRDLLARLLQQGSGFRLTLFWKHAY